MPSASIDAAAVAPLGARTRHSGPSASEASRIAASAHPAPRSAADVGGPATSTSTTSSAGPKERIASAMPGVRATRTTPLPSARTPAAIGGRFGPCRTTSSRDGDHAHGTAVLVGQSAGDASDLGGDLAAERAAVGERAGGLASGLAP